MGTQDTPVGVRRGVGTPFGGLPALKWEHRHILGTLVPALVRTWVWDRDSDQDGDGERGLVETLRLEHVKCGSPLADCLHLGGLSRHL